MARGKFAEWLEADNILLIQSLARNGLSDEKIAHNMGIAYSTLKIWKDKYPSLFESLKRGKEVIDVEVEYALLKRALGDGDVIESERREFENRYSVGFLVYLV